MQLSDRPSSEQPIPVHARAAFHGSLFTVHQWEQEVYDGSVQIFEKVSRPDTAYVIPVLESGRLLIVAQSQPGKIAPRLGLIGGRIEDGETPEMAARREMREEGGVVGGNLTLWESFQFLPKIDWAIYIFAVTGAEIQRPDLDAGERIALRDVTFEELITLAGEEEFGDVEVALKLLRTAMHPTQKDRARRIFSTNPWRPGLAAR